MNVADVRDSCVAKSGNVFTDPLLSKHGATVIPMLPKQHPQHLVLQHAHDLMLVVNGAQVPQDRMVVVQQIVVLVLLTSQMQCSLIHLADRRLLHDNSRPRKKQGFVMN